MKYKVGNKVKIKNWIEMEKEFGLSGYETINCPLPFVLRMEQIVQEFDTDRILTIESISKNNCYCYNGSSYYMEKGEGYHWSDDMIEELISSNKIEPETYNPIKSRWEILDL